MANGARKHPNRGRPFHSKKYPGVYHVCSNCTEGNNIETENLAPGKGRGRRRGEDAHLCFHCQRLIDQKKC